MSETTPEGNRLAITKIEGRIDTLEAKVEGEMARQGDAVKSMEATCKRLESAVDGFSEKTTEHINKHYEELDDHRTDLATINQKFKGHEQVCTQRDQNIQETIESSIRSLKTDLLKEQLLAQKSDAETKKSDRRWLIGLIITIIIALIGWFH